MLPVFIVVLCSGVVVEVGEEETAAIRVKDYHLHERFGQGGSEGKVLGLWKEQMKEVTYVPVLKL
jgi:hypothetical protein